MFGFIRNRIHFRCLMYAGTFTAGMKNTNFKPIYMQNKGTCNRTQVPHYLYSSSPESCLTFLYLLMLHCMKTMNIHPTLKFMIQEIFFSVLSCGQTSAIFPVGREHSQEVIYLHSACQPTFLFWRHSTTLLFQEI